MKEKNVSLLSALLIIGLVPLLATSIVLTIGSINKVKKTTEESTYQRLRIAAEDLGKYYVDDIVETGEVLYEHDYVDSLLNDNIELTVFLGDTRYITSIKNDKGERNEGTKADPDIYKEVCKGNDYYSDGVPISDGSYYVYYVPIKDENGKVLGMAFAGEPEDTVKAEIRKTASSAVVVAVIFTLLFSGIVTYIANRLRKDITNVINITDTLANGHLGVDVNMSSSVSEIQTLIQASAKLQEKLGGVISGVLQDVDNLDTNMINITDKVNGCNQVAEGIASAIDEITKGNLDMAESVQKTAEQMKDIGDHITEITRLATNATMASDAVKLESSEAKKQLEQLMDANSKTVQISDDVVAGIHASSKAVEDIRQAADMIAQIASQTSLLALNASIEAARAGEFGRGFSVVASEISNLATQSDESTQVIQKVVAGIIDASQQNIVLANRIKDAVNNEGTVLSQVSNSFDVVNDKIVQSADAIVEITRKSEGLDAAKGNVLDEINTLSSISEQDAASCQETNANMEEFTANMETINQQAMDTQDTSNQLKEAVSYFQI
ncbi:MAG: methyl-accepting chemotaxis protein [Lachnospiraceae bacterium]